VDSGGYTSTSESGGWTTDSDDSDEDEINSGDEDSDSDDDALETASSAEVDYDEETDDDDDDTSSRSSAVPSDAYGTAFLAVPGGFQYLAPATAYAAETEEGTEAGTDRAGSSTSDGGTGADQAGTRASNAGTDAESLTASEILGKPGPFLIMRRPASSPDGPVTLVAMTSLAPAVEVATETAWKIAAILTVLLVLTGVFTWYMTGRTLRPVEQMRREVEAISPNDLDKRVTAPDGDPDLSALAVTFNGLLGRVQAALAEQRRFVSDASHELKSPIAATGLMLETLRAHPDQVGNCQVIDDLTAENDRMEHIVSDLLTLARQDEGRLSTKIRLVDYCDLIFEETDSLRRRCSVSVDDTNVAPIVGKTDPSMLSHALRNLLDNAARYAKTCIYVSCFEHEGMTEIRISDDGPGVAPEDRERIFGRFVRVESDRSRAQGSTGLGLAVTRGIVEQLGGAVRFVDPDHGGATVVITLPIEPGSDAR